MLVVSVGSYIRMLVDLDKNKLGVSCIKFDGFKMDAYY
jgi:hypothetical protein